MINKKLAVYLGQRGYGELHHTSLKNRDGTPVRCRVNGKCKVWKRSPRDFQLPVKHGLKDCFYVSNRTAPNFHDWVFQPYEDSRKERWQADLDPMFKAIVEACFALTGGTQHKDGSTSYPDPDIVGRLPALADRAEELGLLNLTHFIRAGILPV